MVIEILRIVGSFYFLSSIFIVVDKRSFAFNTVVFPFSIHFVCFVSYLILCFVLF